MSTTAESPNTLLIEGLAAAARVVRGRLLELAEEVLSPGHSVEVLEAPEPSTVMGRFAAGRGEQCVSEIVVTTARVRAGTAQAWAVVLGWDEEAALAAAIVAATNPEAAQDLSGIALREEAEQRREKSSAVVATRMEMA